MTLTNATVETLKTICSDRIQALAHLMLHSDQNLSSEEIEQLNDQYCLISDALTELERLEA